MIRIRRAVEPGALRKARAEHLPQVRKRVEDSADDLKFGRSYRVAAEPLWRAQGRKCCYCECPLPRPSYNDVEHFRPKTRAIRSPGMPTDGYWWLAWTWENLLFACSFCNRTGKNDRFPLEQGSPILVPEQAPPGDERPLLIDPSLAQDCDPLEEIAFVPERVKIESRWVTRWRPMGRTGGSGRGQVTIDTFHLDDDYLIDEYERHLRQNLSPRIESFMNGPIAEADREKISRQWQRLVCSFLRVDSPFAGLNHDVIDRRVNVQTRHRWNLDLPRPPIEFA